MITPERHRILIVPDFGTGAGTGNILALKEAIEAQGEAKVIVAELRQMVLDEHQGEELQEARVIELAARKLEALAADRGLNWGPLVDDCPGDPVHEFGLENETESGHDDGHDETLKAPEVPRTVIHKFGKRTLTIHVSRTSDDETGAPHTIVVFGRSAMLADGVGKTDVLFINPEYDSEWPWKKQYYAGRKAAENYYSDKLFPQERFETAYSFGTVGYGRFPQPSRYGIFTSDEAFRSDWDFGERYPRLSMVNTAANDNVPAMAELICSFDARKMDIPLQEIDRMSMDLPRQRLLSQPEYCCFAEPVQVGGVTAVAFGFEFRTPMGNGNSGLRVKIEGRDESVPIEAFTHYANLAALRDAMVKACEAAKELEKSMRRIMIVPDYFTPHDSPAVLELRHRLEEKGYQVTIFCAGGTLEKSRHGLERICKRRRYDLILTIETGCLLAARLSASHRIYVNPDWTAWEWMERRLGGEKALFEHRGDHEGPMFSYRIDPDEIDMARDMGRRYNIRKGDRMSLGWFTADQIDTQIPREHMDRFGSAAYPPLIGLDTEAGIAALANETDKILKTDED